MEASMVHVCTVCGYQYNDDVEIKPFDPLPPDWACPVCGAPKNSFVAIKVDYDEGDG